MRSWNRAADWLRPALLTRVSLNEPDIINVVIYFRLPCRPIGAYRDWKIEV